MFDEVYRLQALLARLSRLHAVLACWVRRPGPEERLLTTASLSAWRALRGVAGLLAAQPHCSFHPPPIRRPRLRIRLRAAAVALLRDGTARRLRWLTAELDGLTRVVADIAAVSRAPAVLHTCTRIQEQFKILIDSARCEEHECAIRRQRLEKGRVTAAVDFRAASRVDFRAAPGVEFRAAAAGDFHPAAAVDFRAGAAVDSRQSRPSMLSSSESI